MNLSRTPMPAIATDRAWTGLVLAGGRSSRMGRDKAALVWHGKSLLRHMIDMLCLAGAARVVVSGDYPEYGGIPDVEHDLGPLGGLASVAAVLPDGPLLVVPVDMPMLSVDALRRLVATGARCACFHGHMLPLRLQLDSRVRDWLATALRLPQAGRSLHALHAAQGGIQLALPDGAASWLCNLNTPEQWREAAG
ncbi:molybdenum cofactor guanylyltransferase [Thermomonas sp.]|uniref:molybdenum cofactor guanylyltransferase n=1 Tax=Thermomonas sp. TaxID=1971895 RepID=UPI003D0A00EF